MLALGPNLSLLQALLSSNPQEKLQHISRSPLAHWNVMYRIGKAEKELQTGKIQVLVFVMSAMMSRCAEQCTLLNNLRHGDIHKLLDTAGKESLLLEAHNSKAASTERLAQ